MLDFFSGKPTNNDNHLKWMTLETSADLAALDRQSFEMPVIIFKHSSRCAISRMALQLFERTYSGKKESAFLLNVLESRPLSDAIAMQYGTKHESPQILLIQKGCCIYSKSHSDIDAAEVQNILSI